MSPLSGDNVKIIPFCIPLPSASSLIIASAIVGEEEDTNDNATTSYGIVGTITLRGKSAVVWFGWGDIESGDSSDIVTEKDGVVSVGNGKPSMRSLALSTVSTIGRDKGIPATTQLLGGSNEEDMIVGQQISARLAKKIGWPIFISCSLNSSGGGSNDLRGEQEGSDLPVMSDADDSMQHHAAALAEKEVACILLHEKSKYFEK